MDKITTVKNWLLSRVGNPYLMGGTGQVCTKAYREARAAQYPGSAAKIKKNCQRMNGGPNTCKGCRYFDESTGQGKRAYDCAQLTRWAMDAVGISLVSGATSQWTRTNWAIMGEMDTLPADKMAILYRQDSPSVMGHTGIALGDGSCVHAKGHDYGVVREGIEAYGRWTHWAIPVGLYDQAEPSAGKAEEYIVTDVKVALRKGMTKQSELNGPRIDIGEIVQGVAVTSDWVAVAYQGRSGYMMAEFLQPLNSVGDADDAPEDAQEPAQEPQEQPEQITLTLDKETAKKLLEALKNGINEG